MINNNPFFSIVIPLYNKEPHIKRAIDSVLNQTYNNFELIIINDASTDNSMAKVLKFKDERIKLYNRDKPGPGGYAARNLGIAKTSGKWVAFLDADDEWYPKHLEKMKSIIEMHPHTFFIGAGYHVKKNENIKADSYYSKYHLRGPHLLTVHDYLSSCLDDTRPVHTLVTAINKVSPAAKSLFPAEYEARRGGDLHAWLKMICFHKEMAWSNHLGGIYHQDSLNMVTKSAPSSPYLMSKAIYKDLSSKLNSHEKYLLKIYFNKRLVKSWQSNRQRGHESFKLSQSLFWSGVYYKTLEILISILVIKPLRQKLGSLRRNFKKRAVK